MRDSSIVWRLIPLACVVLAWGSWPDAQQQADAGFVTYSAEDLIGAGNGAGNTGRVPVGTSAAAAEFAQFIADLGIGADYGVESFERFLGVNPTGSVASAIALDLQFDRVLSSGTMSVTADLTGIGQVAEIPEVNRNSAGRYPVTVPVGGDQYFDTNFALLAFTIVFSSPVDAVGFFGTDVGDFDGQLRLNLTHADNSLSQIVLPHQTSGTVGDPANNWNASLMFFGVHSTSPIKSVSLENLGSGYDRFGFDNLVIAQQSTTIVPEPSSILLAACGMVIGGVAQARGRRRRVVSTQ